MVMNFKMSHLNFFLKNMEFSMISLVFRTDPHQNGVAERKNRSL